MIRLINDVQALKQYPEQDVFATRIFALLQTYGTDFSFACFWVQEQKECFTALIGALDSHFTLSYQEDADLEELQAFFLAVGIATLQCDDAFLLDLPCQKGLLMKKEQNAAHSPLQPDITIQERCGLDAVYRLNSLSETHMNYKDWYADLSRRIRQGTAHAFAVEADGQVVCTALITAQTAYSAVIGYMATPEAFRRKGYASCLLNFITTQQTKSCFLLCEQKNVAFYEQNGFCVIGKWRTYQNDILLSNRF